MWDFPWGCPLEVTTQILFAVFYGAAVLHFAACLLSVYIHVVSPADAVPVETRTDNASTAFLVVLAIARIDPAAQLLRDLRTVSQRALYKPTVIAGDECVERGSVLPEIATELVDTAGYETREIFEVFL